MTQTFQLDALIVGAGISGLMAARALKDAGRRVQLVDKGRSVGGRLATRRIGDGLADHGAQFFTVRDPAFRALVDEWLAEGLVYEWSRGWSDGSLVTTRDSHPRYATKGGMNALAKHVALGLDARTNVRLVSVKPIEGGWQVEDENAVTARARSLILTPPVPQSLALLDAGEVQIDARDRTALERVTYEPCIAALVRIEGGEVRLPPPGAIQRHGAQITWIADNQRKGISPDAAVLTIHAGGNYSRQLYDAPDDRVASALRVDLMPFLGDNVRIVETEVKRWRYSVPTVLHPERYLQAKGVHAPLFFAGDAFGGPRVEGAVLSGMAAGRALASTL